MFFFFLDFVTYRCRPSYRSMRYLSSFVYMKFVKWQWDMFSSKCLCFSVSFIRPTVLHIHSCIIPTLNDEVTVPTDMESPRRRNNNAQCMSAWSVIFCFYSLKITNRSVQKYLTIIIPCTATLLVETVSLVLWLFVFFMLLWCLCLMGLQFNCIQHVSPCRCKFEWQVAIHLVIKKSIQPSAIFDRAGISLSEKWQAGQPGFDFR